MYACELASTRFNHQTYGENMAYRTNDEPIYASPMQMGEKYPIDRPIYVVEMNNEINEVVGIGLIYNRIHFDERHHIHSDRNYNRYIYKGKYWINREQIPGGLLTDLENVLFRGLSHQKRISGISVITKKLLDRWNLDLNKMKKKVRQCFINVHYRDDRCSGNQRIIPIKRVKS